MPQTPATVGRVSESPDTTPQNALERLFARKSADQTPEQLRNGAVLCAVLAVAGLVIGASGEWWGWAAAVGFGLVAIVVGRQWRRVR